MAIKYRGKILIGRIMSVHMCYLQMISCFQMYSPETCYVLFRWSVSWEKLFLCLAALVLNALIVMLFRYYKNTLFSFRIISVAGHNSDF